MTALQGPILAIDDLWVSFSRAGSQIPIVRGVSLEVEPGRRIGVVGESGSGKSVTALAIMNLLDKGVAVSGGSITLDGENLGQVSERRMNDIRGRRVAMVFQDPMSSLNPVRRIGSLLGEVLSRHDNLKRRSANARAAALLARVGIPDPDHCLRVYPHQLSGGMRQRVMIAMALAGKPDVIIADEPTTALDVTVQSQIISLLARLVEDDGTAVILISHDLAVVSGFAEHVIIMYAGRIVEQGPVEEIFNATQHPYTRALIASIPGHDARGKQMLRRIPGAPPDVRHIPTGCSFHPRCTDRFAQCRTELPPLVRYGPSHYSACLLTPERTDDIR